MKEFQVSRAKVDPGKIPDEVYHSMARGLLEYIKRHPELRDEYEKETGKSFTR